MKQVHHVDSIASDFLVFIDPARHWVSCESVSFSSRVCIFLVCTCFDCCFLYLQ